MGKLYLNGEIALTSNLSYEEFKKSSLFTGQSGNRFFWLEKICQLNQFENKFKVGLCFRSNLLNRVELFCIDDKIDSEEQRKVIHDNIKNHICKMQGVLYKSIESSYDKRNNYSSILIVLN